MGVRLKCLTHDAELDAEELAAANHSLDEGVEQTGIDAGSLFDHGDVRQETSADIEDAVRLGMALGLPIRHVRIMKRPMVMMHRSSMR